MPTKSTPAFTYQNHFGHHDGGYLVRRGDVW